MLERFIYGKPLTENGANNSPDVLAMTSGLTAEDTVLCRSLASVDHMPSTSDQAVGMFQASDSNFILARASYQDHDPEYPLTEYIIVPRDVLQGMSGNIKTLVEVTETNIPTYQGTYRPLEALNIPPMPTMAMDKRKTLFQRVIDHYGDLQILFKLLDAIVGSQGIQIADYDTPLTERLDMVEAIMLLLPPVMRPDITFTTYTEKPDIARALIVFSETPESASRLRVNGTALPRHDAWHTRYAAHLAELWQDDLDTFVHQLREIDALTTHIYTGGDIATGLNQITERHILDLQVARKVNDKDDTDVVIDPQMLQNVLRDNPPADPPLLESYATRLLDYALEARDTDSAKIVAGLMDANHELDSKLNAILDRHLEIEPDAVYSFIRAHLSNGMNERWLPRLSAAAVVSLHIAINDGDSDTLISWLRLIAREPVSYKLGAVLEEGLLAAQKHTHEDGKLGMQLLNFAVKRAHNSLDMLLDDDDLIAKLHDPLGAALRDYDPTAVADMLVGGRDIGMVVLAQGAEKQVSRIFNGETIPLLWQAYNSNDTGTLPPRYQPSTVVDHLLNGIDWLDDEAIRVLLNEFVKASRSDLFRQMSTALSQQNRLLPILINALENQVDSSVDNVMNLVSQVLSDETITPQQAVDIYLRLLADDSWAEGLHPLVTQVARTLQQYPATTIDESTLWHMVEIARERKNEVIARAISRRVMQFIARLKEEEELVGKLEFVLEQLQWSGGVQAPVLKGWREFVREQPLTRLHAFDRLMDDRKLLVEARSIVQTTLAVRKMLGKRTLQEFAEEVGTAYTILEALSDSFDPDNRQPIDFDQATVRDELETHEGALSANERNLLAKNLKELAQLMIRMADNRSKATLIRREGNIERGLLTGEQSPQSAIDTMKWLAGYLSGLQERDEDDT